MKEFRPFHKNLFKYIWKFVPYSKKHGFKKALERSFEKLRNQPFDVKDPMARMGLNFALSTVERGETLKNLISQYIEIQGKRYLDVGCAYGGFLVAFKKAGASEVVGVDIDPSLLAHCKALLQDHCLDISSYQKDILEKGDIPRHRHYTSKKEGFLENRSSTQKSSVSTFVPVPAGSLEPRL